MVARIQGRPKASDLSDAAVLQACEQYADKGLPHPIDAFPEMPRKVVIAKLHKLSTRGLVFTKDSKITKAGRAVLAKMDVPEEATA